MVSAYDITKPLAISITCRYINREYPRHPFSMKERKTDDPYWQSDHSLGEGGFYKQSNTLRPSLHQSEERYYGS